MLIVLAIRHGDGMRTLRIAALTDIHAMAAGLRTALADARREGFDVLLVLGDLLTYGVTPRETIDLVNDAVARDGAILITGNHDSIYLDLADRGSGYLAALPDWLQETVTWTADRVPAGAMQSFDWRHAWSHGPLFAAHANPYAFGDWRYLNDQAQAESAAIALAERGFGYGVFGHTHRARRFDFPAASIYTLGSLGQPRDDQEPRLQWAMIDVDEDQVTVEPRMVAFDRDAHVDAIRSTSLSAATQDRLCGFFS